MSIKEQMLNVLEERGISIQDFCKMANVGKNAIYDLDKFNPSLRNILKMADTLSISLDYLAELSDKEDFELKSYEIKFYENLTNLLQSFSITKDKFYKDLNLSTDAFTRWKKGAIPYFSTVVQIAKYLNVSIDELLGRKL